MARSRILQLFVAANANISKVNFDETTCAVFASLLSDVSQPEAIDIVSMWRAYVEEQIDKVFGTVGYGSCASLYLFSAWPSYL